MSSMIVLTRGVRDYRATIPEFVHAGDLVLEVGCAWGTTTALLNRRARKVIGIDKGAALRTAREKYPHIQFEQIDGFDLSRIFALGLRFTKIYIDISGCRDIVDVVSMVSRYRSALKPEVIVVKSTKLKQFVSRCTVWAADRNRS